MLTTLQTQIIGLQLTVDKIATIPTEKYEQLSRPMVDVRRDSGINPPSTAASYWRPLHWSNIWAGVRESR